MLKLPESALTDGAVELRRGVVCATDDFDVYRSSVLDAYYPARLEIVGAHRHLSKARMSAVRLTDMTIGVVRFGADVLIDPGMFGAITSTCPWRGPWPRVAARNSSSPHPSGPRCTHRTSTPSSHGGEPTPRRSASRSIDLLWSGNSLGFSGAR